MWEKILSNKRIMRFDLQKVRGQRLDELVTAKIPGFSKDLAVYLIRRGAVIVDGRRVHSESRKITKSKTLIIGIHPVQTELLPKIPLQIVHQDQEFLVLNKPIKQHVQGTPFGDEGSLLRETELWVREKKLKKSGFFVELVHRIDRLTSGLVVIALSKSAASALGNQLRDRTLSRTYQALVEGFINQDSGKWDFKLKKAGPNVQVRKDGKLALTYFKVVHRDLKNSRTLLELSLVTGRTHQIRVHSSHAGHPIVGDLRYGGSEADRLYLHAHTLTLRHPRTQEEMVFNATCDW